MLRRRASARKSTSRSSGCKPTISTFIICTGQIRSFRSKRPPARLRSSFRKARSALLGSVIWTGRRPNSSARSHRCDLAEEFGLRPVQITDPNSADLAFLKELRKRAGGLFDRNDRIWPVQMINVDIVGLQPLERLVDFLADARRRSIAMNVAVAPFEAAFGGDQDALASAIGGQCPADDLLGNAEAIDRRGIYQIDTAIDRDLDRTERASRIAAAPHPTADRPRPESDPRGEHVGAADFDCLHLSSSLCLRCGTTLKTGM